MKKWIYIMFIFLTVLTLGSCKKNKDKKNSDNNQNITIIPSPTVRITPEPTSPPETAEDNHEGEMKSYLTGLWVPIETGTKRPYAIQFSNFKTVRNQWGIGQADIVYEALVEGGITRLLAIGENYSGDRIGSIRSSRHYFASFADEYDAIYIHYGKTKYATSKIKELGIDNLDGETGIGTTVFYRDKSMKAPHNAFTSLDKILAGIEKKGYRTELKSDYEPHFKFYEQDTDIDGSACNKITIKYPYNKPYLEYNSSDKLYYRYQFGEVHKDSNTGEQLKFKNIIVQFVKEWDIDRNGYQTMELENAEGTGYYITNGKMVPITWKKNESKKWMRYYDSSGQELTINPGKTYIAIYPNNKTKDVVIE
ncbi:DUF3048 family protein [Herbinix hemicellulosilytica]|uniref:Putative secreted protein n=1 Tax=Herbinix hemicellulosilytica TaxID=1564487 RepID=A0A0H5SHJ2_HERHM|nr:DUF3048 domain-containing protein [Herbinix hemicellulosilytica]RBP60589.1 DUF3048 family protein [Herbinix hemicellulosilytica]CRZ34276.1 putative secreted protein [Herbinix hemicellulosilytica]